MGFFKKYYYSLLPKNYYKYEGSYEEHDYIQEINLKTKERKIFIIEYESQDFIPFKIDVKGQIDFDDLEEYSCTKISENDLQEIEDVKLLIQAYKEIDKLRNN